MRKMFLAMSALIGIMIFTSIVEANPQKPFSSSVFNFHKLVSDSTSKIGEISIRMLENDEFEVLHKDLMPGYEVLVLPQKLKARVLSDKYREGGELVVELFDENRISQLQLVIVQSPDSTEPRIFARSKVDNKRALLHVKIEMDFIFGSRSIYPE